MVKDLVSILIPVYNSAKYLSDCFANIDNQTYKKFEVIFVNDGSTDDSLVKLEEYQKEHSNVKIISQENQGISGARNTLFKYVSGEYSYFLDPDDFIHPRTIELLVKTIKEQKVDLVSCFYKFCKEKTSYNKIHWKNVKKVKTKYVNSENLIRFLTNEFYASGCAAQAKLFKTELLQQIEEFPNIIPLCYSVGEDFYLNTMYLQKCKNACLLNHTFLFYRLRKNSITHSKKFDKRNLNYLDVEKRFYDVPRLKKELVAMKGTKAFHAIGVLWFMMSGKYYNADDANRAWNILKENVKYCYSLKYHRFYYFFLPLTILFFGPFVLKARRKTKKLLADKNQ